MWLICSPQCCVHLLLCRPNRPLPNPVYEYEYMGSGSGGVALASMTKNPSYVTAREAVTSFSSTPQEDTEKEKDHTYEVLPFEANEEEVQGVHVYVNQWLVEMQRVCAVHVMLLLQFVMFMFIEL